MLPGVYPLPGALRAVAAVAPRAKIYVTGYPQIFGSKITNPLGCQVNDQAPLFVTADDAAWVRSKAKQAEHGHRLSREDGPARWRERPLRRRRRRLPRHSDATSEPTKKLQVTVAERSRLDPGQPDRPALLLPKPPSIPPLAVQPAYASAVRHRAWR